MDSSGLVETASGNLHYVSKLVNFGVSPDLDGGGIVQCRTQSETVWEEAKKREGCAEGNSVLQIPPRGETRRVYLDMQWTKFGFRLQVSGIMLCS